MIRRLTSSGFYLTQGDAIVRRIGAVCWKAREDASAAHLSSACRVFVPAFLSHISACR